MSSGKPAAPMRQTLPYKAVAAAVPHACMHSSMQPPRPSGAATQTIPHQPGQAGPDPHPTPATPPPEVVPLPHVALVQLAVVELTQPRALQVGLPQAEAGAVAGDACQRLPDLIQLGHLLVMLRVGHLGGWVGGGWGCRRRWMMEAGYDSDGSSWCV
jgi:hypothetical protein